MHKKYKRWQFTSIAIKLENSNFRIPTGLLFVYACSKKRLFLLIVYFQMHTTTSSIQKRNQAKFGQRRERKNANYSNRLSSLIRIIAAHKFRLVPWEKEETAK